MSIFRSPEYQALEASRRPYDGPPEPRPVNRAALAWLMSIRQARLSPDAKTVAYAIGTEIIAGRPIDQMSLRWGTGLRPADLHTALRELSTAGLIEIEAGAVVLITEGS